MISKLIISMLFIGVTSFASGGGSVIGNGAGIVENNFQFAYLSLANTISECISQLKCEMSPSEIKILQNMQTVLQINKSNEKRLLFVSEKDYPDFFKTGEDQVHRIAKTGLTADAPIYINVDLLYTAQGLPAFDYATIVSILAHEVGHQTGEESHAKLDIIGSKLKKVILEKITTHAVQVGANSEQVEVMIINQNYPYLTTEMTLSWQNVGSALVTKELIQATHCSSKESTLAGVEIDNGHYTSIVAGDSEQQIHIGFGAWVHLSCYSEQNQKMTTEIKVVEAQISRNLTLTVTAVHDL